MSLLGLIIENIFPERSDYRIVKKLSVDDLLLHLKPTEVSGIVYLLPFSEPIVRATIHEAKFQHNEKAWKLLGGVLSTYLKHYPAGTILLPVPLSTERQKERGYNQVTEVAKEALLTLKNIKLSRKVLVRLRDTKPQTTLQQKERHVNMQGAFGTFHSSSISGKNIIILDDVTTTGATLRSAKDALRHIDTASVTLISIAH